MKPSTPQTIKLYPGLSAAALKGGIDKDLALCYNPNRRDGIKPVVTVSKRKLRSRQCREPVVPAFSSVKLILALWYELRSINVTGCGRLLLNEVLVALVSNFDYTESTAYRLLQAGNGRLWVIYQSPRLPGLSQIKIYSLRKVAEYLGTYPGRPVEIRASDFRGRQTKTALLYASFFKPDGSKAKPISRDSIEVATGVKRRQQQRYDKEAGIKRVANFAFQQDEQGKLTPIRHLVEGKSRQWWKNKRLGNTYHSRALKAHKGMTKRVNAELQRSFNSDEARLPKRFFLSAKTLIKDLERHKEAFLLVNKRDRLIKGRMEWCMA
ncbi:hypothetical protein ES703_65697 [subsurface metagenome]